MDMPQYDIFRALKFNMLMACCVWLAWYWLGGDFAIQSIVANWEVSVTMIFGSLVGGGTSEGGGAVAFPVFTKFLGIAPKDARVFALACQSVGMTAASLTILYMGVRIEWRVLPWAGIAGIVGIIFSTFFVMPHVSPPLVKISFTVMVSALAIALVILNRKENSDRNEQLLIFGAREKGLMILTGFVGGIMSGLVGCGENIATFMVMVLLFRLSEKVATPTTVILMTMVTLVGFALHVFVTGHFTPVVQGYWLAAVPIVVVGAPLGALICSQMSKRTIAHVLIFLITLEFISTVSIIPMSANVAATAGATLAICGLLNWYMCSIRTYLPGYVAKKDAIPAGSFVAA